MVFINGVFIPRSRTVVVVNGLAVLALHTTLVVVVQYDSATRKAAVRLLVAASVPCGWLGRTCEH